MDFMELSPGLAPAPKSFAKYFLSAFTKTFGQNEPGQDPILFYYYQSPNFSWESVLSFFVIALYEVRHQAQYARHLTA